MLTQSKQVRITPILEDLAELCLSSNLKRSKDDSVLVTVRHHVLDYEDTE
jgi:hypothetical protein